MENTIYIKCDKSLFSKNSFITILFASFLVAALSLLFKSYYIITDSGCYATITICFIAASFSLFNINKAQASQYIFLKQDEIWFTDKNKNDVTCLKLDKVKYFETRFSKIIFSTVNDEKVTLELNAVADEKKRWQIKEFIKAHVTQQKV